MNRPDAIDKANEQAAFAEGLAAAHRNMGYHEDEAQLRSISVSLRKLAQNICAQGYVGCHGGHNCTSDHK